MTVIVVSDNAFSGGDSFAKALADRLGYRLIDAGAVIERAAACGPSHQELNEALRRPPRAWDRFLRKRRRNLIVLQSALAEELGRGGAVCYSNLGDLLLGLDDCLRIRIEAPPEFRIETVCDRLKLSRDEAVDYVRREDRNSERWLRDVCGRDAPGGADIVLDLERIAVQEACELATRLVQSRSPSIRSRASALDDFALSCRARAALAMAPETANLELDAAAEAGVVRLSGMIRSPEQLREIQGVTWSVPAIAGVLLNGETLQRPAVASRNVTLEPSDEGTQGFPRWKPLRHAWAQIGLALCLTIAGSWSLSQLGSRKRANLLAREDVRTFVGIITDTICGPKPEMGAQCVRACVRTAGAKYALYDGHKLYSLSDQEVADGYAAQRVRVRGTLDAAAGALKVDSIQPIS